MNLNRKPTLITFDKFKELDSKTILDRFLNIPLELSKNVLYLVKYLSELNCTHCLIEYNYISASWWYDYSSYYARQTDSVVQKYAIRTHFFALGDTVELTTDSFVSQYIIEGKIQNQDICNYLGYAVWKPLDNPRSILGAMLLKTYPDNDPNLDRFYPCTRGYEINILGRTLELDTLVTQSQDAVAACASTTLFSALHLLSNVLHTPKLFPAQITKIAYRNYPNADRALPNRKGLDRKQIVGVLRDLRLAHEFIPLTKKDQSSSSITRLNFLRAIIYAYSIECRFPVLVMIERFGNKEISSEEEKGEYHLVVNTGIEVRKKLMHDNTDKLAMYSDNIINLLWSDDNYGPFAGVEITDSTAVISDFEVKSGTINTYEITCTYDKLEGVIVPIPRSITVQFETILKHIEGIKEILKALGVSMNDDFWEIYLQPSNKLKENILDYEQNELQPLLYTSLPAYVWIAKSMESDGNLKALFIFDTTVQPESPHFCRFSYFTTTINKVIKDNLSEIQKAHRDNNDTPDVSNDKKIMMTTCYTIFENQGKLQA